VKVLFVCLAFTTLWLITKTRRDRNKIMYLRNEVAQLRKILIKLELIYGKQKNKKREGEKGKSVDSLPTE
jgi:hypothetical protein